MTIRLYLAAAQLLSGPPEAGDLPIVRLFIDATDVHEFWIETEHRDVPEVGKSVSFSLPRPLDLGFERVTGTIERRINKQTKHRA
jgi:hypothetical protein